MLQLFLSGFPKWDMDGEMPHNVEFTVRKGVDRSSRDIAIEWDDIGKGKFYYQDWTDDNIPFVREGETYRSSFWFQKASDAKKFVERYL